MYQLPSVFPLLWTEPTGWILHQLCKVLSVPFACVGSGDPVRVLRLYTMNTLDTLWSIYCWGICTTCRYPFYCVMLKPYALRLPTATCVWVRLWLSVTVRRTVLCGALYTACVDASRTVFGTVQSIAVSNYSEKSTLFLIFSICQMFSGDYWQFLFRNFSKVEPTNDINEVSMHQRSMFTSRF